MGINDAIKQEVMKNLGKAGSWTFMDGEELPISEVRVILKTEGETISFDFYAKEGKGREIYENEIKQIVSDDKMKESNENKRVVCEIISYIKENSYNAINVHDLLEAEIVKEKSRRESPSKIRKALNLMAEKRILDKEEHGMRFVNWKVLEKYKC
jgi:hypothetical protein